MKNKGNVVRGSVRIVACQACNKKIPIFNFESETDVGAIGLYSAAQCNNFNLVIAETTLDEWKKIESEKLSFFPSRLNEYLNLRNFYILHIKRIEEGPKIKPGLSFSDFRKLYKSPTVVYSCPCCNIGEAIQIQELTVPEFKEMGGKIFVLGNLILGE
jgi:hypothetical protein